MFKVCTAANTWVLLSIMKCGGCSQREPRSRRGLEAPDSLGRDNIPVQSPTLNMVTLTKICFAPVVGAEHFILEQHCIEVLQSGLY